MKRTAGFVFLLLMSLQLYAQHQLKIIVRSDETKEPLAAASIAIAAISKGTVTDSTGTAILTNLPTGIFQIEISYIGYASAKQKITLPYNKPVLEIALEGVNEEDNPDIVITTTRTDRSVGNTPTRVEVIAGGEISETVSMRPGEIKMLLNETTGLITQQTSAISNTANIRIQELDGRYTQVLRDGFPLYSGLSEGLSLVQIAPLDLKQVEIIKGSSSTLYGGGAIAGLINLVSKTPADKRELRFLANVTSAGGLDLSGFYSERYNKAGLTLFLSRNSGTAYDPSTTGLTAIPKFSRYTIAPRFFLYGKKTDVTIGVGYITEDRLGGTMAYVTHRTPGYFEKNNSNRFTAQIGVTHKLNDHALLHFKNSYNYFNRSITIPAYQFQGLQQASFSELSLNTGRFKSQWITGFNLYTDAFSEVLHAAFPPRSYTHTTIGGFVQNTWSPSSFLSIESGVRSDYTKRYELIFLPRLSALFHFSDAVTSRIGGGLGYKLPTIFTEESEERQFKNIMPVDELATMYERSIGGNIDFTYKTNFHEARLTINPLFFYTRINHPLLLQAGVNGQQQFVNASGYTDSKGLDLSFRLTLDAIKFFTGYSYTIAQNHFNGITTTYPLAPEHKLHFDLVYELEGRLRVAFESYYTGKQQLSDGGFGKHYWTLGALAEKTWKHFAVFINGEDLNDARQTRWDSIYTGTIDNPSFRDIYAPLEGIIVNAGVKIKL